MDVVNCKRIFRADGRWLLPLIAGEHVLSTFQCSTSTKLRHSNLLPYLKSHHICIDQLPELKELIHTLMCQVSLVKDTNQFVIKRQTLHVSIKSNLDQGQQIHILTSEENKHTRSFTECKLPHPSSCQIRTGPKR